MAYLVKVRGVQDAMEIEGQSGAALKAKWEQYHRKEIRDELIEIGSFEGWLSDIRWFKRMAEYPQGDEDDRVRMDEAREYAAQIAVPSEIRAKRLNFFSFLFSSFFRGEPSPEQKNAAEKIQKEFFEKNPRRLYCDPMCYLDLLLVPVHERKLCSMPQKVERTMWGIIERVVHFDERRARA